MKQHLPIWSVSLILRSTIILAEEISPGDSVELQVVAHDGDGDALIYVWEVDKGKLDSRTGRIVKWAVPLQI